MAQELKRYFIELEPQQSLFPSEAPLPRDHETNARRRQASNYVQTLHHWLTSRDMNNQVYNLAITALGLVHITCTPDVISMIRHDEVCPVASIRQGAPYMEQLNNRMC